MKFKPNIDYVRHIGVNVGISAGTTFSTHDGSKWLIKDQKGRRYLFRKINVGNNVMMGTNTIILPGVTIQDNVVIAARQCGNLINPFRKN